jgi:hypothetical protein
MSTLKVRCADDSAHTKDLLDSRSFVYYSLTLTIYDLLQYTPGPAFVQWLVIHMGAGGAGLRSLDGEGVFEFLHPRLQILDFSPLLFDEQVFDPVQS